MFIFSGTMSTPHVRTVTAAPAALPVLPIGVFIRPTGWSDWLDSRMNITTDPSDWFDWLIRLIRATGNDLADSIQSIRLIRLYVYYFLYFFTCSGACVPYTMLRASKDSWSEEAPLSSPDIVSYTWQHRHRRVGSCSVSFHKYPSSHWCWAEAMMTLAR